MSFSVHAHRIGPAVLLFLLAAALPAGSTAAQVVEGSDKERRDAAREEQRRARADQEAAAEAEAEAAEASAEEARLAGMGVEAATLLETEPGFFVAVDAFFAEPGGADRSVARVGDVVTSATTVAELDTDGNGLPDAFSIQNERSLDLEYDGEATPQLELGWRFGTGSAFSVRYWAYSSDAEASASSFFSVPDGAGGVGLVLGGIDNQGFENTIEAAAADPAGFARPFGAPSLPADTRLHGADQVVAEGSFDATRLDLLYTHVGLARPRIELLYRVGLTFLGVEREESAAFRWQSFESSAVATGSLIEESVAASADTSAFGVLVGVAGRFRLSEDGRWAVRAGLELSGVTNEQDLSFRNGWVLNPDSASPRETVAQDTTSSPSKSLVSTIDADFAVEARVGSGGRVGLGYRHADWMEAVTEQRFPDAANQAQLLSSGVDVDFSGPYLRFSWFF